MRPWQPHMRSCHVDRVETGHHGRIYVMEIGKCYTSEPLTSPHHISTPWRSFQFSLKGTRASSHEGQD